MGQSNSQPKTPRQEVVKGPPPRPAEPPSCKPVSDLGPRGPSYYNPENKVLPSVLPTAKNLRPVSQELQQYHPDFKEIFKSDDFTDVPVNNGDILENNNKENVIVNGSVNSSINGDVSLTNGDIQHIQNVEYMDKNISNGDLKQRPQSVIVQGSKSKGHRRQMSASSSLYTKENTIQEDPNEPSLNSRGKIDPYSLDHSFNPQVSIPVKPTFDMDTSYNLTYAQLAEARRNKTLQELEKRTGKKIEDLSADLAENADNDLPSFSRQPSTRSVKSSSSVDSVLKKKRRAPPPPTQPPPPPLSQQNHAPSLSTTGRSLSTPAPPRPIQPPQKSYSFDSEPPVDYDMDVPLHTPSKVISRSHSLRSTESSNVRAPPPPPPNVPPPPLQSILRKSSGNLNGNVSSSPSTPINSPRNLPERQPSFKSPPVLPPASMQTQPSNLLMEIQKQAENMSVRRQMSESAETKSAPSTPRLPPHNVTTSLTEMPKKEEEPNLVFDSTPLYTPRSEEAKSPPSIERQNSTTSSSSAVSSKASDPNGAVRRLNSLLQHDIKIAAQAKATKIVKHTTPVKEKPKDPAEVFRETLAKAAAAREERCKNGKTIDAQLKQKQKGDENKTDSKAVFKTDEVVVKRVDSFKNNEKAKKKEEIVIENKELEAFPRPKFIKKGSQKKNKQMSERSVVPNPRQRIPDSDDENDENTKLQYHNSIYAAKEWIPEDDLDSDDNIDDNDILSSSRNGQTEGFKTSIVPNKVKDLKTNKGNGKDKKYTKKNSDTSAEDRRKFDSIKRFKKSVHKNVRNAFGSISKASGKILKKQKSEDIENSIIEPKNWKLSNSVSEPSFGSRGNLASGVLSNSRPNSASSSKYIVENDEHDDEEDSSADESFADSSVKEESVTSKHSVQFANEEGDNNEDSDGDHTTMKRAGVAYVNKKGQIVLLPEYDTVKVDENGHPINDFEGRAPKINAKKKKFTYDATVRKKEREVIEEQVTAEALEKEKQREAEKLKENETELEFKKMRELEARNRLQRLELQAQMQQQLLQQQQQQMGYLSAPPLPPPSGFQQGYNPAAFSFSNINGQSNLQQNGMNVPYANPTTYSGPFFNAGVPGMSYDWSEYVRMMGMPAPQTTPQQYTYMLNSMNWPGIDMNKGSLNDLLVYPNKLQQDDSQRNQVYQTWVGPTKQVVSKLQADTTGRQINVDDTSLSNNGEIKDASNSSSQYHYGARKSDSDKRNSGEKKTNPLYTEDDSDISDGLSPQKSEESMVARIHVKDYREIPNYGNGQESVLFKSSISVPNLSTTTAVVNGDIR